MSCNSELIDYKIMAVLEIVILKHINISFEHYSDLD